MIVAEKSPYSDKELSTLRETLFQEYALTNFTNSDLFEITTSTDNEIVDTLDASHLENPGPLEDARIYILTFLQYLLINYRKIFVFLTQVPIDKVPLYLNKPTIKAFARWRLTIAK
jgi:hypothetical protein